MVASVIMRPMSRSSTSGFTLIELMVTVAVIALLAAAAIPQYSRYVRRSRTAEAPMMLANLYHAALAYRESSRTDASGVYLKQWPGPISVPWAPAVGTCCTSPGPKCSPNPSLWQAPTWQALTFSVDEANFYSYWFSGWQFGKGDTAGDIFHVAASGDLDCNGVYSLFRRSATVGSDGQILGSSMYYVNELE